MLERDERESAGAEVCPEEKRSEGVVGESSREPRLFSELETPITEREMVIAAVEEREEGRATPEDAVPAPAVLTARRKGGAFRRVVEVEPQVEGAALSGEQRLLILDAWARSELTAGVFGRIAGVAS